MNVAQRAREGLYACQSLTPRDSRLALTLGPLYSCVRWHSRSVRLRPSCHICQAKASLGLGPRTTVGRAAKPALPSHELRRRRGSTAVVCAGGPSGGLQKVKRVRSGEVNPTCPYPIAHTTYQVSVFCCSHRRSVFTGGYAWQKVARRNCVCLCWPCAVHPFH